MKELVFLLEERSARAMLESLLPRLLGDQVTFRLIPFEGKQDLEKQLTRKIRAYQNPDARFIVLRDLDSSPDCTSVKTNLISLCNASGKGGQCLVRLACKELEAFYLADLASVEIALGINGIARQQQSRKFRNPDSLGNPSQELKTLTRNIYEKVASSRMIGKYLRLDNDRSPSFRTLITGIRRLQAELLGNL